MRQQVDRLPNLSVSMLDLSRVDSGAVRLEAGDIDITTLTRSVLDEFRRRRREPRRHVRGDGAGRAGGRLRRAAA